MPDAVLVAAAEAVKTAFNGHVFSVTPLVAERSYADWDLALEDAGTLRADIVQAGYAKIEMATRGEIRYEPFVDVGIRKRFGEGDQAANGRIDVADIDALVLLVEEVNEFFLGEILSDSRGSAWKACAIRANPVTKHLRELRQFTGILRLTFDSLKAIP